MVPTDRRLTHRRESMTEVIAGHASTDERRAQDRRQVPRRRADARTIAHFAHSIAAGDSRLEVIVESGDGMRMVAMFHCGCVAMEPIGEGLRDLQAEPCRHHVPPAVVNERRQRG